MRPSKLTKGICRAMTGTAIMKAEKTLVHYNAARTELAKAVKIDEVKAILHMATAAKVYAKQAQDKTMLADATEIMLRAKRKVGEMLITMEERGERRVRGTVKGRTYIGGKGSGRDSTKGSKTLDPASSPPSLRDLGITDGQSFEWRKLAREPAKEFEKTVREAKIGRKKPAPIKRDWPDGDAPKPEFDRQVFLFGARDALEIGQTVLDDIGEADFPNYKELEDAATKVVKMWNEVLIQLKRKGKSK